MVWSLSIRCMNWHLHAEGMPELILPYYATEKLIKPEYCQVCRSILANKIAQKYAEIAVIRCSRESGYCIFLTRSAYTIASFFSYSKIGYD